MTFAFVAKHRHIWPVSWMCEVLGVSRSGFHAWLKRPISARASYDAKLVLEIDKSFKASDRTYGARRVWRDVLEDGFSCGLHRIERLMRQNAMRARPKRRGKPKDDGERSVIADNILDRDFQAERPNQKWLADFTYIWTAEGWLYVSVVLDLFSRRVVGWATSDRLKRDLAVEALRRALVARNPGPGLVHHSDRGSQYCSVDYQALLRKRGILISMSGRGNCYDNSMVEAFFKTIKSELVWPVAWQSRAQAENAVARYIDGFYNPVRRHSSLGFQSPIAFERKPREVS